MLSHVRHFATPWTAAHQASLSITNSWSLLKLMSIDPVITSNHLILYCPLLLLSIFPSIRVFSNDSVLLIRWPKYWNFSLSISPSNEYSRLISFRIDWLDLLAVQGTLKSLVQHHSSKATILQHMYTHTYTNTYIYNFGFFCNMLWLKRDIYTYVSIFLQLFSSLCIKTLHFCLLFQLKYSLATENPVLLQSEEVPCSSVSKASTCNAEESWFNSWVRKFPWRRKWQPTPVFLPGESHRERCLAGYSSWDHKSQT